MSFTPDAQIWAWPSASGRTKAISVRLVIVTAGCDALVKIVVGFVLWVSPESVSATTSVPLALVASNTIRPPRPPSGLLYVTPGGGVYRTGRVTKGSGVGANMPSLVFHHSEPFSAHITLMPFEIHVGSDFAALSGEREVLDVAAIVERTVSTTPDALTMAIRLPSGDHWPPPTLVSWTGTVARVPALPADRAIVERGEPVVPARLVSGRTVDGSDADRNGGDRDGGDDHRPAYRL